MKKDVIVFAAMTVMLVLVICSCGNGGKYPTDAAGTELAYSCSFSGTYPTALDAISHVAKIKLIDLSAHRDEYNELRREQDKVEKEFRQSRGQQY
jgi:hypothetical protein